MYSLNANSPFSAAGKPSSSSSSQQPKSLTHLRSLRLPLKPKTLQTLRAAGAPPPAPPSPASSLPSLKSRLRAGETLYGLFLLSFSPTIAEIAAFAGYDFVVVDMEHGPGGIPESLDCIRALAAARTPAILRLPESTAAWAKKALDIGPEGIMFPMIDGPSQARDAVSYCRFPLNGVRGSAHTVVRASKYGIDEGYLENCEENLLIMCQVETVEGVKNVREIVSVDGVDCIQMGPLDLSASMGFLWDPANKKVREMLRKAEEGVLGSGTAYMSGFAMPHDSPLELRRRGYHMVSGAVDVGLFRSAAVEDVKRFKMGLGMETSSDDEENERDKDADEKYWSE
ncbi:hypothetical protein MLD38_039222 [Melastoma candidum]|uniref:Uncharacterized protein n=1 Tax=Melastoma candidum TaxID=119954 RepID=A0ACB9L2R2_9MYRT|nr:hypothetical protein MLD38_039222 [Melastoma candidum]